MKTHAPRALIAIGLTLAAGAAMAKPRLEISIAQAREVADGAAPQKTRLVPVQSAAPGDIVQYTLSYANRGDEAAKDAVIDDPIPKGTSFIASSAIAPGAEVTFSSDGGKTFATPVKLTYEIRLPSGQADQRIATPGEYTHIRFTIKQVPAGASGSVAFRVRVN